MGIVPPLCGLASDGSEVCRPVIVYRHESLIGLPADWVLVAIAGALTAALIAWAWGRTSLLSCRTRGTTTQAETGLAP